MQPHEFSTGMLSRRIRAIVGPVQRVFQAEKGENYDDALVEAGLRACITRALDRLDEDMLEMFTTPGRVEFEELADVLEQRAHASREAVAIEELAQIAHEHGDLSVFEGYRPFSKSKMAAMMEYLTAKGNVVYKTSLNKLLFYSDLTHFYLRNYGISGAVYHNRPFGPVADPAEPILAELVQDERLRVRPQTRTIEANVGVDTGAGSLSSDEKRVLDWVADTYGHMNASQISELSHREMAYKYTESNQPIAYAYSKFLKHLPPKDLLDN